MTVRSAVRPGAPGSFRPLASPQKLTSTLIEHLRHEIESGRLAAGARLPTEQEMTAAFGVSRTVIREAVAALRSEGLVVTRQGVGAFVSHGSPRPFRINPDDLLSLRDAVKVMELRKGVEVEAAGLAAERRDAAQMATIAAAWDELEAAVARGEAGVDADFAFHYAIAEATGNQYFTQLLRFLGRLIIPRQSVRLAEHDASRQTAYLRRVQAEHAAIVAAIREQNPTAARRAMTRHLGNSLARYRRLSEKADTPPPRR
jgi:GntR family transcriptional repressor for pyruvate dehydrogenase complex